MLSAHSLVFNALQLKSVANAIINIIYQPPKRILNLLVIFAILASITVCPAPMLIIAPFVKMAYTLME